MGRTERGSQDAEQDVFVILKANSKNALYSNSFQYNRREILHRKQIRYVIGNSI